MLLKGCKLENCYGDVEAVASRKDKTLESQKKKVWRDNVDFGESDKYMKREDKNNH